MWSVKVTLWPWDLRRVGLPIWTLIIDLVYLNLQRNAVNLLIWLDALFIPVLCTDTFCEVALDVWLGWHRCKSVQTLPCRLHAATGDTIWCKTCSTSTFKHKPLISFSVDVKIASPDVRECQNSCSLNKQFVSPRLHSSVARTQHISSIFAVWGERASLFQKGQLSYQAHLPRCIFKDWIQKFIPIFENRDTGLRR